MARLDSDSPPDYASIRTGDDAETSNHTEVSAKGGLSNSEPRYVYYHVYSPEGLLRSLKTSPGENPFTRRIKATSVPPPHTVSSLKRAIVQEEALPDPEGDLTVLFQTRDALSAMVTSARVEILTGDFGATAKAAVAVVGR
ncbi:hypothetical protein K438DRAFT_1845534 [Mycena galopus ATCC 62051]|nr:hypothetical protein K438DRAFT_1845534 [Mycena galopus ATCC 62051]